MKKKTSTKGYHRALTSFIMVLILITTSFMVVSCGNDDAKSSDAESTKTAKQTEEISKEKKDKKNKETTEETKEDQDKETKEAAANTSKSSNTKKAGSTKSADNGSKSSTKQKSSSSKSTKKATEAAKVCYISVEGNFSDKKMTIQSGESVYDILKRTGVNVSARSSKYGIYVEGIGGKFEFDEGPTSGWVYYVNGTEPSESCGNYKVKSGDRIVWDYVEGY